MEAKITVKTKFDESMIVQEIHGASHGESLVKSVIRLKEDGTRKALSELGYMEPAEAKTLRARVAELEARAVVVPEYETMADLAWKHYFDPLQGPTDMFAAGRTAMYKAMCAELRAIPADRGLREWKTPADHPEWPEQERRRGKSPGFKRRCLQSMVVGQTSVFYPGDEATGDEHAVAQCANERRIIDDAPMLHMIEAVHAPARSA